MSRASKSLLMNRKEMDTERAPVMLWQNIWVKFHMLLLRPPDLPQLQNLPPGSTLYESAPSHAPTATPGFLWLCLWILKFSFMNVTWTDFCFLQWGTKWAITSSLLQAVRLEHRVEKESARGWRWRGGRGQALEGIEHWGLDQPCTWNLSLTYDMTFDL